MSPARTSDHGIDLNRVVKRIVLDVALLKWFATTGGRGHDAISAIAAAKRAAMNEEAPILDFLEQHVTGGRADG